MFYDTDIENVTSYADNNTTYTSSFNLEEGLKKLELSIKACSDGSKTMTWKTILKGVI